MKVSLEKQNCVKGVADEEREKQEGRKEGREEGRDWKGLEGSDGT